MLKLFITVALSLFVIGSFAKDTPSKVQKPIKVDKEVICFPIKTLLKDLRSKYGEEPMLFGKNSAMEDVVTAVYVNRETGTYTVIEMDNEAGCVISIGTEVHYRFPKFGNDAL